MTRLFSSLMALMIPHFLGIASLATPVLNRAILPNAGAVRDVSSRSDSTCADPSLARAVFQGFSGSKLAHFLNYHSAFVHGNSIQAAGPPFWSFQGPVFKGWTTQQPSTVPLFSFVTPSGNDYFFKLGTDTQTPPIVNGFNNYGLVIWVYNTAVCGSVPLMSAVLATQSDHYWTTDPDEHADLIVRGWADGGIVAYVLPLASL